MKHRHNSSNYKVVTGVCSSTGKRLGKELTDALTAGKGVIRVHF